MSKKIRIAFIKDGGLSSGGSEKFLQIIAASLPKDKFEVDYFYCDPIPLHGENISKVITDPHRLIFMKDHSVNLIKFTAKSKDIYSPFHTWKETNFFDVFNEDSYDMVQTCRAGHKEFPFIKINKIPIIDVIALSSGSDNQYNIARVLHICSWSSKGWIKRGGDKKRIRIISLPISTRGSEDVNDLRSKLGLDSHFIFGMHQREEDSIFSEIPLLAYKKIENDNTAFIIMGGGKRYKQQAEKLNLKNFFSVEGSGDSKIIFSFLKTLNVFAHGRKDGEVNSQAMAEAMYFGLPIVSHFSSINNGHVECISDAGLVTHDVDEYSEEMLKLYDDKDYYAYRSNCARNNFLKNYEVSGQIKRFVEIYEDVYRNPYPEKLSRYYSSFHYTQNLRVLAVIFYLKIKKLLDNFNSF